MYRGIYFGFHFQIWKINFSQVRWKAILSYGFALAGMNALFYLSLERLPIGIAVAFEFIGPLSVALYHAKQKYDFVWVTFAIIGLILLFPFNQAHSLDWIGVLFAMSAGACWALYIIAGQKPSGISGNHTVCLGMTVGACILLPITFFSGSIGQVIELPYFLFYWSRRFSQCTSILFRNVSSTQFNTFKFWNIDEPRASCCCTFRFYLLR